MHRRLSGGPFLRYGAIALAALAVFALTVVLTARPDILSGLASAPQCRASAAIAEAVAPHARGTMAGFATVQPADLTALPYDGTGPSARTVADFEGRVTLFNLWATWCAPCRAEMPSLAALQEARGDEAFQVVATSIDNTERGDPERFLAETGATALDYHREPTLALFNSLRAAGLARGMPTTLLIGPDGCVAGVLSGAAPWDGVDALRLVDAAVAAAMEGHGVR
ncbi:TlpA family protein disulfide reductase [Acuticoccus sp.]|uniref:TlpA family protein disulfide reductase n=1 Tax=Acuticoccus sp. TaxID=1904378 RepID=UPI003B51E033